MPRARRRRGPRREPVPPPAVRRAARQREAQHGLPRRHLQHAARPRRRRRRAALRRRGRAARAGCDGGRPRREPRGARFPAVDQLARARAARDRRRGRDARRPARPAGDGRGPAGRRRLVTCQPRAEARLLQGRQRQLRRRPRHQGLRLLSRRHRRCRHHRRQRQAHPRAHVAAHALPRDPLPLGPQWQRGLAPLRGGRRRVGQLAGCRQARCRAHRLPQGRLHRLGRLLAGAHLRHRAARRRRRADHSGRHAGGQGPQRQVCHLVRAQGGLHGLPAARGYRRVQA
mmetsp:Transcript_15990/g.43407  ORF Transcript_15990/g.43407 Transcript_15990/m.43407 type:complete len:286 (+) Transcript_15990:781-1638(+)